MSWFRKEKKKLEAKERRELPSDVFEKCEACGEILYRARLAKNAYVCPACGNHLRIRADDYLSLLLDEESFEERDGDLRSTDPLRFHDLKPYAERLKAAERKTSRDDAVVTGTGRIETIPVKIGVMDFEFIGGSMGSVVGERLARIGQVALADGDPLIIVSASGGARMQEGILSLMQMAKTAAVLARLHEAGVPYVSVLTDPTTGGVTASYAMLGDANIAEPGALIGFAGPRVIEQTIKQALPEGFQRSEFLLSHGMLDAIVDRRELRPTIARLLRHMLGLPRPAPDGDEAGTASPGEAAASAAAGNGVGKGAGSTDPGAGDPHEGRAAASNAARDDGSGNGAAAPAEGDGATKSDPQGAATEDDGV